MDSYKLDNKDNHEYWSRQRYHYRQCPSIGCSNVWEVVDSWKTKNKILNFLDRMFGVPTIDKEVIGIRYSRDQAKELAFLLNGDRDLCVELMTKDKID